MGASPVYASVPLCGVADVSTANTNRDGTGTISGAIVTAPAAGALLETITLKATGDPADSVVVIYRHDGTTAHCFDEFDLANPAAGSTTVEASRWSRRYDGIYLPNGWSIRASITVALTSGVIKVFVDAASLT